MNTPLSNARWLGMALCGGAMEQPWLRPVPATAVGAVVYYALVPGVLGFWLLFAGSSRVSGAEASLMTALMPVWHWHWPLRCLASASRPRRSPAVRWCWARWRWRRGGEIDALRQCMMAACP